MISLTINGLSVSVPEGTTILEAARDLGIRIPTLCNFEMPALGIKHRLGSCRVCVALVASRDVTMATARVRVRNTAVRT